MKLTIREDSQNYACSVIKLPVKQTIPGLDNLVKVEVFGNDCLIGKNSNPNVLYLFFPAGSKICNEFLSDNNLYRDQQLNADITQKGFFEPNGRVKGLKLKGIVSNGFVIPLEALAKIGKYSSELTAGDEFTTIDGVDICQKYFVPSNTPGTPAGDKQPKVNNKLRDLLIPTQFRFHDETSHLAKNLHQIKPDDIIVITDKWHGSSCILSKVFINKPLNKIQKLINKYLKFIEPYKTRKIGYIYSSGKPKSSLPKGIENEWTNKGQDFYNTNIWQRAANDFKDAVEDGISIYSELVGFESGGGYIQKQYDYNCKLSEYRMMVYRITYTKPNGSVIEFSWQQIKDYCTKYNLEHVKEFYFGKASGAVGLVNSPDIETWQEQWQGLLLNQLSKMYNLEMNCKQCANKVPAEGIVVRVDGKLNDYKAYKLKSKAFVLKETNEEEAEKES